MYLLDTTVFSFILRNDPLLQLYEEAAGNAGGLFLSAMSVCELYSGAQLRGWGERRRAELDRHIGGCTVLPIDATIAATYGDAIATSRAAGRELTPPDALIVATAKRYGLTLLTHDRDMTVGEQLGVEVICRA